MNEWKTFECRVPMGEAAPKLAAALKENRLPPFLGFGGWRRRITGSLEGNSFELYSRNYRTPKQMKVRLIGEFYARGKTTNVRYRLETADASRIAKLISAFFGLQLLILLFAQVKSGPSAGGLTLSLVVAALVSFSLWKLQGFADSEARKLETFLKGTLNAHH